MRLTLLEFEVVSYLHRYGAASPRELNRKLSAYSPDSLTSTIQRLLEKGCITQLGTCVSSTNTAAYEALAPHRVRRAVILAAGTSQRMLPATKQLPKPMVKVNGKQIIKTQLDALIAAGITDITIVRGYKGHVFDELVDEYPMITFVNNPDAAITNNIVSTSLVAHRLDNTYVVEGDLYLKNHTIIRPYEYRSHYCGVRQTVTEDWYFETDGSKITNVDFGTAQDQHQYVGISFWTAEDAKKLEQDIASVLSEPGGDQLFLEAVPLKVHKTHYEVHVREVQHADVIELDTYQELCTIDPSYEAKA
jgi:CTP:phosphocholine cytidylyltransferase-like protein